MAQLVALFACVICGCSKADLHKGREKRAPAKRPTTPKGLEGSTLIERLLVHLFRQSPSLVYCVNFWTSGQTTVAVVRSKCSDVFSNFFPRPLFSIT